VRPSSGRTSVAVRCRGVQAHDHEVDALQAAVFVGKCPRALTARRIQALIDSIVLVMQMMERIS
jgi:hypothetical protein